MSGKFTVRQLDIGVVLAVLTSTVGFIWFLATLDTTIKVLDARVKLLEGAMRAVGTPDVYQRRLRQIADAIEADTITRLTNTISTGTNRVMIVGTHIQWGTCAAVRTPSTDILSVDGQFPQPFVVVPRVAFGILPSPNGARGVTVKQLVCDTNGFRGQLYVDGGNVFGSGDVTVDYVAIGTTK